MPSSLPDFTDPPVVEVALSVQYEPLTALCTPAMGLLWSEFRDRFPNVEEHAPLEAVIERFGVKGPKKVGVRVEMMPKPPVPRCWFLNEAGTELIQVQQDRFVHNWRKVGEGEDYPRFEHVRDRFKRELRVFESFVRREKLGELVPTQCEVTYVNHIVAGRGWERHGQLGEVLTLFVPKYSEAFLPEPEDARMAVRYVIPGADGEPLGRLHIVMEPGYRRDDNRPMFLLDLTARGRPERDGVDGVLRFLEIGREWVVRGFAAVTTAQMHKIWGRRDDH